MTQSSPTDQRISQARSLLIEESTAFSPWAALGAATLAAMAAVLMAGVVVLGPGVQFDDPAVQTAP